MNLAKKVQFMFNEKGKKAFAVLPIDVYDHFQDIYEEFEAIKAYDRAKKSSKFETIPLDQMIKEVNTIRKSKKK